MVVWVISRTSGMPLGPEPWTPERVGAADLIATADELGLAVLVALHLRGSLRGVRVAAVAGAVLLVLFSGLTFTLSGHTH